jgi:Tripartite tricarboxylate transporter family receptor
LEVGHAFFSISAGLIAGQVHVMFPATVSSIEYIRDGRLRALAVTSATRSKLLPDMPTVGEFVPGYQASGWFGVGAPKAAPVEIVEKLNKEINAGLASPKLTDFGTRGRNASAATQPSSSVIGAPRQLGLDFPEPQRIHHFTLSRFDNGAETLGRPMCAEGVL